MEIPLTPGKRGYRKLPAKRGLIEIRWRHIVHASRALVHVAFRVLPRHYCNSCGTGMVTFSEATHSVPLAPRRAEHPGPIAQAGVSHLLYIYHFKATCRSCRQISLPPPTPGKRDTGCSGIGSPVELRNARRETAARPALCFSSGYIYIISKLLAVHADKSAFPSNPGKRDTGCSGIGSPVKLRNARRETAARPALRFSSGYIYIISKLLAVHADKSAFPSNPS
jgi:hypothetical protein